MSAYTGVEKTGRRKRAAFGFAAGRRILFPALTALSVVALAGCQTAGEDKKKEDPLAAFAPLPAVCTATFEDGSLDGWKAEPPSAWKAEAGRYQALTRDDQATVSLRASDVLTNFLVEADYIREQASVSAGGLVVRASEDFRGWERGSGYLFGLGWGGVSWHYAVYRQSEGKIEFLRKWEPSRWIQSNSNRLAVLAEKDQLRFYINGHPVWACREKVLLSGQSGLFGSTSPGSEAVHLFDNFSVKAAPEPPPVQPAAPAKSGPRASKPKAEEKPGKPSESRSRSPVLRPGLLVQVSVLVSGKREVDAEVKRVSDDNRLELPLIGSVAVEGMTLSELTAVLEQRYREYFINPQVQAEFVFEERPDAISPWGYVVVMGRVKSPGRVNIPPTQDLTVSGAIQLAGGLDTSARGSAIRLTRRKPDGRTERITIDFTAVGTHGNVENDVILKPGDVIWVPESVF